MKPLGKNPGNIFLVLLGGLLLQSCVFGAYDKKINDDYSLRALDVMEQMTLGYGEHGIGVIGPTVFAVGRNSDYLIVKQHPANSRDESDRAITNYFIIPLKKKISESPEKNLYGPMDKVEFLKKMNDLDINNIRFDLVFKGLE